MRLPFRQSRNKRALKKVYKILESPDHWTQRTWAKTADGYPVSYCDPTASQFCLTGAMHKVTINDEPLYKDLEKYLQRQLLDPLLALFNDTHTHDEVMTFLKRAIEAA